MTQKRIWVVVLIIAALLVLVAVAGIGEGSNRPLVGKAGVAEADQGVAVEVLLSGFAGAFFVFLLGWAREWWRNARERRGLLRLLLSEVEHNEEMLQSFKESDLFERPKASDPDAELVWSQIYLKTETWHQTRTRAVQLLDPELLEQLDRYYGTLDIMLTLEKFPGKDEERMVRLNRRILGEATGKEWVRSRDPWADYGRIFTESQAHLRDNLRLATEGAQRQWWRRVFGS